MEEKGGRRKRRSEERDEGKEERDGGERGKQGRNRARTDVTKGSPGRVVGILVISIGSTFCLLLSLPYILMAQFY